MTDPRPGERVRWPYREGGPAPVLTGEVEREWRPGLWAIAFRRADGAAGLVILGRSRFEVVAPPLQGRLDFEEEK